MLEAHPAAVGYREELCHPTTGPAVREPVRAYRALVAPIGPRFAVKQIIDSAPM